MWLYFYVKNEINILTLYVIHVEDFKIILKRLEHWNIFLLLTFECKFFQNINQKISVAFVLIWFYFYPILFYSYPILSLKNDGFIMISIYSGFG